MGISFNSALKSFIGSIEYPKELSCKVVFFFLLLNVR